MGRYDGTYWQGLQLSLAAGLQGRADDRARPQPFLEVCRDAQFDEIGGLQTRLPYAAAAGAIFGGGTIANARRIVAYGDELVLFTKDSLYSWNAQLAKWVLRGTHLAVAVDEAPRFATTGDQIDGDRAELAGTIVYAWTEAAQVYAAALDKATLSVLVAPTAVSTAVGRPRLVALAAKILLFTDAGSSNLTVRAIDPAAPATAIGGAGTTVLASNYNAYYDVVKAGSQDLAVGACRRSTTTSYTVFSVTPALVVTAVTKARTADGPLAVAAIPDGTKTQVVRGNGTNVQGDLLTTSTLVDVTTGQAIGTALSTPINQIAACFRSVTTGGAFRCYVFWSAVESDSGPWESRFNFVDSAGTIGTAASFVKRVGVASRAFDRDGSVFVWMAFAQVSRATNSITPGVQNSYFLYRDDAFLAAKSVYLIGGGHSPSIGHLPGVASIGGNSLAWCASFRRSIPLGVDGTGYGPRSPIDVTIEFDATRARRCAALGRTLYIGGGEVLQYDGTRIVECGFHVFSYFFTPVDGSPGVTGGSMASGTYGYKSTYRYVNAQGEQERSTTTAISAVTVGAAAATVAFDSGPLYVTHKIDVPPAFEVWRTTVNQDVGAPFYLATSKDPTALTNPDRYIANNPTLTGLPQFNDFFSDATLSQLEQNPENGAVLESLAPPGASIIIATDTRLFLLGVSGDPDRGWYSRLRGPNEIASFHDTLTFDIPRAGGDVTAGWFDESGTLYVARRTAIYAFAGPGLDNLGQGQNYTFTRIVSADIGVLSQESVAMTPRGMLLKSHKGWHVLGGNGALQYVGDRAYDFDAEAVLAIDVVETQHQVRILTAARMIVWDYLVDQWGEWTIGDGVHACMFQGGHVYLAATGTRTQLTTYTGVDYGIDIETAWIKPANLTADAQNDRAPGGQGDGRVRKLQPLGEYRSAHALRFRVAYNYLATFVDDKTWVQSTNPPVVGGPLQIKHGPKRPICQAIKLRLTVGAATTFDTTTLSAPIAVVGTASIWTAVLTAPAPGGLLLHFNLHGDSIDPPLIEVRDGQVFDGAVWIPAANTVGIGIHGVGTELTVRALEAAFAAGSKLVRVAVPHATPDDAIDMDALIDSGQETFGTFVALALGESLKLTGLGMEVGLDPGLFRRLPPAQQQ